MSEITTGSNEQAVDNISVKDFTKIDSLVLDATPLITQSASALQQHACNFYTTPGVHGELRDEHARSQLVLWADKLKVRHPKPEYIAKVTSFAKLNGDFSVLSLNDLHIIALAYELECELNNGGSRLRNYPGEVKEGEKEVEEQNNYVKKDYKPRVQQEQEDEEEPEQIDDDGFQVVQRPKRNNRYNKKNNKKTYEKPESQIVQEPKEEDKIEKPEIESKQTEESGENGVESTLDEEYNEEDDDGDWITPENLQAELFKDSNEVIQETNDNTSESKIPDTKVALSTGDFACQNTAMQIGIHLMNTSTGRQIKRVRNYMFRCHACFRMTPIPKDGTPKHFCPLCGGNTLLRCAVSIDKDTGKVIPHLKRNFKWITRGQKYTLPSPQSKNQQKLQGNGGYQHNKENRAKTLQNPLILREDQKEYSRAIKDDQWQRRHNEKILQEWIGGGSADNYMSPFGTSQSARHSSVRVGRGRHANASKGQKK